MNGVCDQPAALLLDFRRVGDVEPVGRPVVGGELAGGDPGVDHAGRDAEAFGELGDGDLSGAGVACWVGDLVAPSDPLDVGRGERTAGAGAQPGGVEPLGDLGVGVCGG